MAEQKMQDRSGTVLGGFQIKKQLGAGGMGSVYLAEDAALKRPVALKLLAPSLASDSVFVERFLREARSIAAIRHPNLMHIYTVGEDTGTHFFAMEYIEGKTLGQILSGRKQPLSLAAALHVLEQIMDALKKIHDTGIIHRDLKPGNIMIDSDQRAILVDFGLSKDTTDDGLTQSGMILGTPDYMAPEQIEAAEVGTCTDIYALGIILYEMLTGRTPFRQRSAIMTMRAHCENPVPSVLTERPELPQEVEPILQRMLEKDPQTRIGTIEELATELLRLHRTATLKRLAETYLKTLPAQIAPTIAANPTATASNRVNASSPKSAAASLGVRKAGAASRRQKTVAQQHNDESTHAAMPPARSRNKLIVGIAAAVILILLFAVWKKRRTQRVQQPETETVAPSQTPVTTPQPEAIAPPAIHTGEPTAVATAVTPVVEPTTEIPSDIPVTTTPKEPEPPAQEPVEKLVDQLPPLAEGEREYMNHSHVDPEGKQRQIRLVQTANGNLRIDIAIEDKGVYSAPIKKNDDGTVVLSDPASLEPEQRQVVGSVLRIINRRILENDRNKTRERPLLNRLRDARALPRRPGATNTLP